MERIFETIRDYGMIEAGTRVVAGVSGGADSVCLLLALCGYRERVPFEITVVHVEHGIRGEESLADAEFVEGLCGKLGVPFRLVRVRAEEAARQRRMTVEEAGRALRYEAFENVRRELGAERIAVAHHMGDQAETVLWNLARGSGVRGLGGIRPVRGRVIRPLLFMERSEIEEILRREGAEWRTDRTNLETDYTRNRIRLRVLPVLERELNAGAVRHISEAALRMRELQEYLDGETDRVARSCIRREEGEIFLSLPEFRECPKLIKKELLKRCLVLCRQESEGAAEGCPGTEMFAFAPSGQGEGLKDIGAVHLDMLLALAEMDRGKENHLPGGIRVLREGEGLRFCLWKGKKRQRIAETALPEAKVVELPLPWRKTQETECFAAKVEPPLPGREMFGAGGGLPAAEIFRVGRYRVRAEILENSEALMEEACHPADAESGLDMKNIREKKYTKCMSYDTIYSNVCFRTRRPGDYLIVNRQGGRKKLKDYMIDEKIPKDQRDRVWLLAAGSHVLWVVGWRISEAVKIRQDTRYILKIQMEEERQ